MQQQRRLESKKRFAQMTQDRALEKKFTFGEVSEDLQPVYLPQGAPTATLPREPLIKLESVEETADSRSQESLSKIAAFDTGLVFQDSVFEKANRKMPVVPDEKDFTVKFEGGELPKIRRKVCRKIYSILMEEFNVDKQVAKAATLNLEYRLNSVVDYSSQGEKAYLSFVKNVVQHIKVVPGEQTSPQPIALLNKSLKMSIGEFDKAFRKCI